MVTAKEKLEGFIDKLESRGYEIEPVSKKPQVYRIDGELVNIRSRGNSKAIAGGKGFWYSVSFSVLPQVKWVIYLAANSDHFFMFPSSFLVGLQDRMYPDTKNIGVGVFDIDSSEGYLVLKGGDLKPAWTYEYDLNDRQLYPHF